jgi:putative PIN family toxin of toxin-antitoxin system
VKIVLDTNVFISGVFFTGPPYRILEAWRDRTLELVLSPEILEEYRRVGSELSTRYPTLICDEKTFSQRYTQTW